MYVMSGRGRRKEFATNPSSHLADMATKSTLGVLVAVEYNIDDGLGRQYGDALFYNKDQDRMFAVECKHVNDYLSTQTVQSRTLKVQRQAHTCATRIRSYLDHLCAFDPSLAMFAYTVVVPVALTNQKRKVELLGIEPRSLRPCLTTV
jgi:hypothetical protein